MTDYSKTPVCNTIKNILIGKIFNWQGSRDFIILGVRRNLFHGGLEILIGYIPYNKRYNDYSHSIEVYSWYHYDRRNMWFVGRNNREAIKKCLKTNPKYVQFHLGKQIDSSKLVPATIPVNYVQGSFVVYDSVSKYYLKYLESGK